MILVAVMAREGIGSGVKEELNPKTLSHKVNLKPIESVTF